MSTELKKALVWWFGALLMIAALTTMVRCAKPPMASTATSIDKAVLESHDRVKETDRNKEILDSLKMYIAKIQTGRPDCDSVCQVAVDRLLEQLNVQKMSGDNSYSLLYDKYTRLLTFAAKVGETKNEKEVIETLKTVTTTIYQTRTIPVKYVPDFWKYSAYLGWAAAVYLLYRIYNKVRSIWSPKNIIT